MSSPPGYLRIAGSLWFAAVLLMLLLFAMACATVFESAWGTEQALVVFYKSWWFEGLLGLIALNLLAAVAIRYPFSKRHTGFILTHLGIVLTLAGAVVTKYWGVDGQVGIPEGQTAKEFQVGLPRLSVHEGPGGPSASLSLSGWAFRGLEPVDLGGNPSARLGDLEISALRYLPDAVLGEEVVEDSQEGRPAVEVSVIHASPTHPEHTDWIFEGHSVNIGPATVALRSIRDQEELDRVLAPSPTPEDPTGSRGTVRVQVDEDSFDLSLPECLEKAVPVGDTEYSVRVLRYLPHATVGAGGLTNDPNKRVNPAIECTLTGPKGPERRLAFALHPEFGAMHGAGEDGKVVRIAFVAPEDGLGKEAMEVLRGPDGSLFVRFSRGVRTISSTKIAPGETVDTPSPGLRISLRRLLESASRRLVAEPVQPCRKTRQPAVLVKLARGEAVREAWVPKYSSRSVPFAGTMYELVSGDTSIPLGFEVKLNRFHIGTYPGTGRPRSFESHVTITDPVTGGTHSRVVSMNNPTSFGGYTLFQSSYRQDQGTSMTILSVSWDPGQPIVFAGYIATILGMCIVLGLRMSEERRKKVVSQPPATSGAGNFGIHRPPQEPG